MFDSAGRIRGRKERERGQTGVRRMADTRGWTIDPKEEREYAVEPVGVERIIPSACLFFSRVLALYNLQERKTEKQRRNRKV